VVCWGLNVEGQCSPPSTLEYVVCISAGGYHTAAVTIDGRVSCWGRIDEGQCNVPAGVDNISEITCGFDFTMALTKHRTVICWGANGYGQCKVPLDLLDVVAISAGGSHAAALVRGGQVICWGWNEHGQCQVYESLQVMMNGDAFGDKYSMAQCEHFHRFSRFRTFGLNRTRRLNREIVENANNLRTKNKALHIRWVTLLYLLGYIWCCTCCWEYLFAFAFGRLEADGVWRDVGSVEHVNKYVHHVDELIATLATKRCEERELSRQLASIEREFRSLEWAHMESETLTLPDRVRTLNNKCSKLGDENTQLREKLEEESAQRKQLNDQVGALRTQLSEETGELRRKLAEQATELRTMNEAVTAKKRGGFFG
jgi:hypothetical protein